MWNKIIVPGQPQGKGRARVALHNGFARAYTPDKTAAYENLIKLCYMRANNPKSDATGSLRIHITAYYGVPKSYSKQKRLDALCGKVRPCVKPDIDNVVKVVCDALNGLAYDDDRNIVEVVAEKYYSVKPAVQIEIEEV